MKYLIVRWNPYYIEDDPWHEEREDNTYERKYIKDNGGEVMRAGIDSKRTAHRIAERLDIIEGMS